MNNIQMLYLDIKYKGVLKVWKKGTKEPFERLFYLRPLRRMFANKIVRAQIARDIEKVI